MNGVKLSGDAAIADADSISVWAKDSAVALAGAGVAKLDAGGRFNPKDTVTSVEVSEMLNSLLAALIR